MKTLLIGLSALFISSEMPAQTMRDVKDAHGIEVGRQAPDFSAKDASGESFQLAEELKTGPVVVIFYRGHWCPICNRHLSEIQENLGKIMEKGVRVVAVSPEKPEYLEKTAEKTEAKFTLLYDEDYKIADAYDVSFLPGATTRAMYNTMLGANLKEAQSDDSQRLPIPATYIVNT
ncbi:MAG: AhpC/TSA family protein, partial [Bacteroidales bacterium]|nr:AhpC/TSA family protein [Bacteroidales bacterium]